MHRPVESRLPTAGPTALGPAQLPNQMRFRLLADTRRVTPADLGPAAMSSGTLWIATLQRDQLLTVGADGRVTQMALPAQPAGDFPQGITAASEGTIWISESYGVLEVGPDQRVTAISVVGQPNGQITQGQDGSMWVTELGLDSIARMGGQVKEFPLPRAPRQVQCGGRCPYGIALGPDGNLWITESQLGDGDRVGRMTPDGEFEDWPLPEPGAALDDITAGPDGAMWFGESRAGRIGRISMDGQITEQAVILAPNTYGTDLVTSGGGLVWYAPSSMQAPNPPSLGAARPGGGSELYSIPGGTGAIAAIVPLPSSGGQLVDVVMTSGQVWQGSGAAS